MQTDLEEEKGQEILKLQNSLQVMQSKVDEANALLAKERENAQKEREIAQRESEEASVTVKETPVPVDNSKEIEELSAELETLKVISL